MLTPQTCSKCGQSAEHSLLVDAEDGTRSVLPLCTYHAGQEGVPVAGDELVAAAAALADVPVPVVRQVRHVIRSIIAADRKKDRSLSVETALNRVTAASVAANWKRWALNPVPEALDNIMTAFTSVGLLPARTS